MRHAEKEMDSDEMSRVIGGARLMTLAMCMGDEPYLVTVNFAFDPDETCFFFHCAKTGKKIDYLRSNPLVWGQVMEDGGYVQGKCEHRYRSVHFRGMAKILDDDAEVKKTLTYLIEQQEDDPDPVKKRNIEAGKYAEAMMVRIDVEEFSGKRGD